MVSIDYTIIIDDAMGPEKEQCKLEWHLGDPLPQCTIETKFGSESSESTEVLSVYADGKELDYIRKNFSNLPLPPNIHRTCVWRGDFARFIFDNLTL